MFRKLMATDDNPATLILRLVLGVVFFAHGAQKLLGWFGGPGFSGTMGMFTGYLHIPAPLAFLAIAAEFFGGLGLILGFLTRIAAFGITVNMLVAIAAMEALLHKGPQTISEIQSRVLLASGSMTAAVDRLEEKGLIRRTSAPGDRRVKVLKLTPAGRRVVETAFGRHAAELESAMSVLNPTEKRELRAILKKLGLFAAGIGAETDPRAQEEQ